MEKDTLILAQDQYYSLDCYKTQLNNNVLIVGASGAGKTRSIVMPNLLQATGSYIVSDPKGNLYRKNKAYLESRGYVVKKLDFTDPGKSAHYNCFNYIRKAQDIVKMAHMMVFTPENIRNLDPFWDAAGRLLVQSVIALLMEAGDKRERTLHNVLCLISKCMISEDYADYKNELDEIFDSHLKHKPDSYAVKQYNKFRIAAGKTLKSILITVNSKLGSYDTPELCKMTAYDDIDISSIGKRKTALFVVVSDTDRSLDGLVNLFFTQAMNELCSYADKNCMDEKLPVPVRFILDDFATNVCIDEFPRMIASIRSRGISAMLIIQAESQLKASYGDDDKTIISNCDTYVYMGGNDVETAESVSKRCNLPLLKILNMPVGTNWIFRRGQAPINAKNFDLNAYMETLNINGASLSVKSSDAR